MEEKSLEASKTRIRCLENGDNREIAKKVGFAKYQKPEFAEKGRKKKIIVSENSDKGKQIRGTF